MKFTTDNWRPLSSCQHVPATMLVPRCPLLAQSGRVQHKLKCLLGVVYWTAVQLASGLDELDTPFGVSETDQVRVQL